MTKGKPMSARQFTAALKVLGLTVASQQTSRMIGVGIRQVQRFASGEQPVPRPVELLLAMYITHGLPDDKT